MFIALATLTVFLVIGAALLVSHRYVNARDGGALWTVRLGVPYAFFSYDTPAHPPSSSNVIEVVAQGDRVVMRDVERSGLVRWLHRGSPRVPVSGVLSADRRRLVVWARFGMVARLVVGALLTAAALSVVASDLSGPEGLDAMTALVAVVFAAGTARVAVTMVRRARAYAAHLAAAGPTSPVVPGGPRRPATPGGPSSGGPSSTALPSSRFPARADDVGPVLATTCGRSGLRGEGPEGRAPRREPRGTSAPDGGRRPASATRGRPLR